MHRARIVYRARAQCANWKKCYFWAESCSDETIFDVEGCPRFAKITTVYCVCYLTYPANFGRRVYCVLSMRGDDELML